MRLRALACTGLALACAGPALAQASHAGPDDFSVQALHNFGECVVRNSPGAAAEVLAMDDRTPEYRDRLWRLAGGAADTCRAGGFRMASGQMLLAGSIAERLVVMNTNADGFARRVAYDATKPQVAARSEHEMIGMCLARMAPRESWAVLTSSPAGDDETAAMRAIAPKIGGCVAAGQPVQMNHPALRAMIALGAYQLEHPAAPAASAAKGS